MNTKKLTYAYPSSPDACKYNKGQGCWLIWAHYHVWPEGNKYEALRAFEKIDLPINTLESFTRDHPVFKNDKA